MQTSCQRWGLRVLEILCLILCLCGILVYIVDPCLYYRFPEDGKSVFFNQRYQTAGLLAHSHADMILLGTSMVANYHQSRAAQLWNTSALKLTIPDGYLSEFNMILQAACRQHMPKQVFFALDMNILTRDESQLSDALPDYLYDENRWNDIRYLCNKDAVYYSVYTLWKRWNDTTLDLDEAFVWDEWWNHLAALESYQRPDIAEHPVPVNAFLDNARNNTQVILHWADQYPETQFTIFFSPYSLLYWDKIIRQGELDAVCAALHQSVSMLLGEHYSEQISVYFLPADTEITWNLDFYSDYIHHSGEAADLVLEALRSDHWKISLDNWPEVLQNWRQFVLEYDYNQLWNEAFWEDWNRNHVQ